MTVLEQHLPMFRKPLCTLTGDVFVVQPVQAFVRQAMTFLGKTPDAEVKTELIKTLQAVTEGKVNST